MPRTLFGMSYSPWSIRARWALDHHRLEYRYRLYTPMLDEPLLRLRLGWPSGPISVPILFDGREAIRDSLEIARHADGIGEAEKLFPDGRDVEIRHWSDLAHSISDAGRAYVTPKYMKSPDALDQSMPPWIPVPLRALARPVGRIALRYVADKYDVHEREVQKARSTIRTALRTLRGALEHHPFVLGERFSYGDVAMVSAMQVFSPHPRICKMGDAMREVWTQETIAAEHRDLLEWRDQIVERHLPSREKKTR